MSPPVEILGRNEIPDLTQFTHLPLNQDKNSIRLISVLPTLSKDNLIQCTLRSSVLPPPFIDEQATAVHDELYEPVPSALDGEADEELQPYSCLSYTWGDPHEETAVRVNGKIFYVRRNLWDFLQMARKQLDGTLFWIDALCIDQANTTERNHQVQQMGNIYTRARMVLAWLGNDLELEQILYSLNLANFKSTLYDEDAWEWSRLAPASRAVPRNTCLPNESDLLSSQVILHDLNDLLPSDVVRESKEFNVLRDSTGKLEKFLEKLTENEYWSRAWVTQEVLLARRTIVVAGGAGHGLFSLAGRFRAAVPYFRNTAFENLVDIVLRQGLRGDGTTGLVTWGVVNLLHRFRNKKCAIRRDRIYSLLALCKESRNLKVDYDVPEQNLMRQVLNLRKSSICFCSAAVVSHALSPWEFPSARSTTESPFVETYMYACALSSAICPFCSNWVPFSWTKKKGVVFCLATTCPDTQMHMFWEQSERIENSEPSHQNSLRSPSLVHAQSLQNNKSQLLCPEGAGIDIRQSEWNHVYLLRFTFRSLVEILQEKLTMSDSGLNACSNLWPNALGSTISDEGRLRFCAQG